MPVALIAALALASGITRSTGFTVYSTVGLADMPAELMRDANTLAATSMQLGAGLAVAAATVALRAGAAVTGGGQAAYTLAFCLLALIAAGCAAEALRLDPRAGDAARGRSSARPAAVAAGAAAAAHVCRPPGPTSAHSELPRARRPGEARHVSRCPFGRVSGFASPACPVFAGSS